MISGILKMRTIDDITTLDILTILPHRRPFLLIDNLVHYDPQTTQVRTSFQITEDSPFVQGGCLQAAGIMENIAQSCAARIGFYDWLNELPVKPGVIGAVKDLEIKSFPRVGQTITTYITPKAEAMGVLLAEATVKTSEGSVIAECSIKVAV